MAMVLSGSSSDDGDPPGLVSSSSDAGDRWLATGRAPPGTDAPEETGGSDDEEPDDPAHDTNAACIRQAAHTVVRWCVLLAVCREVVAGDTELYQVQVCLGAKARRGATNSDMEQVELLQVSLINKLHDKAIAMVNAMLNLRPRYAKAW